MRHAILVLLLAGVAQPLFAQEASTGGLSEANATNGSGEIGVWLDLRQTNKAGSVQNAPRWVESIQLIPRDQTVDVGRPTVFRIRLRKEAISSNLLFLRLFFFDKAGVQPQLLVWDESGSQTLRSGRLGSGSEVDNSEAVLIPMHGSSAIDIQVPGDGSNLRGAYLEWMTSSLLAHPVSAGTQAAIPEPFASSTHLAASRQDAEQFGAVTAPLSSDSIHIGPANNQPAVFEFALEARPLLALLTFEIASPRIDSPPGVLVNGQRAGVVSLSLPALADPGYRGETGTLVSEMHFQYTGWIRAQILVPVAALRAGSNEITVVNGAEAENSVIRATQIQLKYVWDKSDYILKPAR